MINVGSDVTCSNNKTDELNELIEAHRERCEWSFMFHGALQLCSETLAHSRFPDYSVTVSGFTTFQADREEKEMWREALWL